MTNLVDAMPPVGIQIKADQAVLLNATGELTKLGGTYVVDVANGSSIQEIASERLAYVKMAMCTVGNGGQQDGICVVALQKNVPFASGSVDGGEILVQVNGYCEARVRAPVAGAIRGSRLYLTTANSYFSVSSSAPATTGNFKVFAKLMQPITVGTTYDENGVLVDGSGSQICLMRVCLLGVAGFSSQGVV